MNARRMTLLLTALTMLAALALGSAAPAQPAPEAPRFRGPDGPQVVSPEVSADRRVTFRILAPKAQAVRLSGSDIPGIGQGAAMTTGSTGAII